ncbi:TolC family protein [Pararobbsia alpina]|uniref:Toluene efflux pump outer membrane protein TtgC n=1 Tax=Pararobbsia alpina TaxID=621374 RepID=A0A6S7BKJ2_9BURK|nr:TolC family protein [Pararobbsia alpina]CAB3803659.1 Toluene efflux pump outer membrane protein TtgC [Pararobbsia alpina]
MEHLAIIPISGVKGLTTIVAAVLLLGACATQPDYVRPDLKPPAAWSNVAPSMSQSIRPAQAAADRNWWLNLHDPAIDALAKSALADNPTLAQALASVDEARAALRLSNAQQLPQVTANGNAAHGEVANPVPITGPYTLGEDAASGGPSLSWELDLWGRLRQSAIASRDRLDAQDADAKWARLSLTAQVADGVLDLRACAFSLAVRNRDITSRQVELDLMRKRLADGNVAPVDEANARTNLANALTDRISQQEQCTRDIDALVALSGRDAETVRRLVSPTVQAGGAPTPAESPAPPPVVEADVTALMPTPPPIELALPATVLLTHPTVVAAEREAAARWSDIAVARADRLPRIDLTAVLTGNWLQALGTAASFQTWSVGGALSAPLFDGGAGAASVHSAQARYREAVANLRQTVLTASQSVEDALAVQLSAEQRMATSQQAVDAGRVSLRADEARWRAGAISIFELEDSRQQFNSAQESAITAARDRAKAWVDLVKATGDGLGAPLTSNAAAATAQTNQPG